MANTMLTLKGVTGYLTDMHSCVFISFHATSRSLSEQCRDINDLPVEQSQIGTVQAVSYIGARSPTEGYSAQS